MISINHYRVLGVTSSISPDELKSAYHKQCLKTHPDRGGSSAAFDEVAKAYDVLSDPIKRREWQREYELAVATQGHVVCQKCYTVNRVRAFKKREAAKCAICGSRLNITPEQRNSRYREAVKDTLGDLLLTVGAETGELAKDAIVLAVNGIRRKLKIARS